MVNMKKRAKKNTYTIYDFDLENRDQILRESRDAIQNYIRNGVKNEQLKKLIDVEDEFQRRYARCFDVEMVIEKIGQIDVKKVNEVQELIAGTEKNMDTELEAMSRIMEYVVKVASDRISKTVANMLEDVAYLSNMNMLYELYEKEEKIRKEREEFEKRAQEAKHLFEIASQLSHRRRMELEEVRKEIEVSKEELENTINKSASYFNVKMRGEKTQISLSPKGIKFVEYVYEQSDNPPKNMMNQIIYQNCYNILDNIEKSCEKKKRENLNLGGMSPNREHAIKQKYMKTMQTLMMNDDIRYEISKDGYWRYCNREESELNGNEKNRFRISRSWDETIF